MRRSVKVASVLLVQSSIAWGQSQVESTGVTPDDSNNADVPLAGNDTNANPSRPDPKAILEVGPAPKNATPELRPGTKDRDELSTHWLFGASLGFVTPLGNFSSGYPIGSRLSSGYGLGLDVGYGITRHFSLSIAGDYQKVYSGSACTTCDASAYAIGLRMRYHLVEGTRFDPWIGYGFGYRQTAFESGSSTTTFDAVEPIRMEVGGDWYATSMLTFGPILSLGIDRTLNATETGDGRWSTILSAGLRIGFDPLQR
jgi:Outer membrane protein beta-barrel domain